MIRQNADPQHCFLDCLIVLAEKFIFALHGLKGNCPIPTAYYCLKNSLLLCMVSREIDLNLPLHTFYHQRVKTVKLTH
jgi:hypothetical protein